MAGQPRLREASSSPDVSPLAIEPVGRYALRFLWSDGHARGIYTFEYLHELCTCPSCSDSRAEHQDITRVHVA